MKARHEELLEDFSAEFPPEVIQRWSRDIEAWNEDPSNRNPYEDAETGKSFQAVSEQSELTLFSLHNGSGPVGVGFGGPEEGRTWISIHAQCVTQFFSASWPGIGGATVCILWNSG